MKPSGRRLRSLLSGLGSAVRLSAPTTTMASALSVVPARDGLAGNRSDVDGQPSRMGIWSSLSIGIGGERRGSFLALIRNRGSHLTGSYLPKLRPAEGSPIDSVLMNKGCLLIRRSLGEEALGV